MNRLKSFLGFPLMAFLSLTFLLTSCKKDNSSAADDATGTIESVEDDNLADYNFESNLDLSLDNVGETYPDLSRNEEIGIVSERFTSTDTNRCAVVTRNRDTFPVTVTIDFGTGCTRWDGRVRKGKIIIVYSGRLRESGKTAEMSFDNYSVDDVKVEGIHKFTNLSSLNQPRFKREIINGKLTWPNGRWITRNAERTVEKNRVNDTTYYFSITGNGKGENSRGKTWESQIQEPLIKRSGCPWISKGIIRFRHNSAVGTLDYGDGSCDGKAILTVNDRSKEITLR